MFRRQPVHQSPTLGRIVALLGSLFPLCASLPACGSGSQSGATTDAAATFATCESDKRAHPYVAGDLFPGKQGMLSVTLLDSVPGPPVKGFNTWRVQISSSANGAVVSNALSVSASGFMPDHNHSTDPIVVTPMADGQYQLDPVRLKMSGYWEITVDVSGQLGEATVSDSAVLTTCVP